MLASGYCSGDEQSEEDEYRAMCDCYCLPVSLTHGTRRRNRTVFFLPCLTRGFFPVLLRCKRGLIGREHTKQYGNALMITIIQRHQQPRQRAAGHITVRRINHLPRAR